MIRGYNYDSQHGIWSLGGAWKNVFLSIQCSLPARQPCEFTEVLGKTAGEGLRLEGQVPVCHLAGPTELTSCLLVPAVLGLDVLVLLAQDRDT